MSRLSTPVIDFAAPITGADPALRDALDTLRAAVGHVTAFIEIPFLVSHTALSIVGAVLPGTSLHPQVKVNPVEWSAGEVRLEVDGQGGGIAASVQLYDVTSGVILATCPVTGGVALYDSGWVTLPRLDAGVERVLEARVVGNGAATQTLTGVRAHFRTTRFTP